jgi:hypothetical protein
MLRSIEHGASPPACTAENARGLLCLDVNLTDDAASVQPSDTALNEKQSEEKC